MDEDQAAVMEREAQRAGDLFARWASAKGILHLATEQECRDLSAAFVAGYLAGHPDFRDPV